MHGRIKRETQLLIQQHSIRQQQFELQREQERLLAQMQQQRRTAPGPTLPLRLLQELAWRRASAYSRPSPAYAAVMQARQPGRPPPPSFAAAMASQALMHDPDL